MRKGQKKRVWTPEQKSEIVHKHLDKYILVRTLEKQYAADWSMICRWVRDNNEILAHQATPIQGSTKPYYHCLEQLKRLVGKKNEEQTPQVVLHTDQGSVYSSQAFRQAHEQYNILRSMSRVGTPTDNAIIEALNGWIKEELFLDFDLATAKDVPKLLCRTSCKT